MSTIAATNLKNASSGSNNIVLGTDGATTLGTAKVTAITDSAGANSSTPAAIANGTCKAWVNFNGTSTVAIRASYNVSSITDNGVGDYTVNFTSALADANYSLVVTNGTDAGTNSSWQGANGLGGTTAPQVGSVRIGTWLGGGGVANRTANDVSYINVAIFR